MSGYNHIQGSANTTWTITHNLNNSNPVVDFWVEDGSPLETTKILPLSVVATSANVITATFSTARAGKAVVVDSDTTGYNHTQGSANTTWTITHNLGATAVCIDVIVLEGGSYETIIPQSVVETNSNTVTITFSTAREGFARIVDAS
jgi:hypothetical protein